MTALIETTESIDLSGRFLCADGDCVGVIGPDGRCKLCATLIDPADVAAFEQITATTLGPDIERPEASVSLSGDQAEPPQEQASPLDETPPDLTSRQLCPDGSCIGAIGADGHCKVCGKHSDDEAS